MSAMVYVHGGETDPYNDGEEGHYAYAVTDAGGLRILMKQPGGEWFVRYDYSPSGWAKAEGTRFLGTQFEQMPGADGSTKTMADPAGPAAS